METTKAIKNRLYGVGLALWTLGELAVDLGPDLIKSLLPYKPEPTEINPGDHEDES